MKVLLFFQSMEKIKTSGIGRAMKHQMKALELNDVPFTIDPKDKFDLAHINTLWNESPRLLKRCKKQGIPVIVHGHSTLEDFRNSFRCWKIAKVWFYHQILWMYKHADLVITPTEYSKELIDAYQLGTEVISVSNGINTQDYAKDETKVEKFKKYFGITNEKVVIGIGYPFERKGIHDFFEIARSYPDIKFIWFGYLAHILTSHKICVAIKHKPSNVIMPGYIDNDVIKGAMHYAECLLFPSYEETEGIVVLEALASKLPVLVRDIGVYKGWLIKDKNAYMAKNNEEFVSELKRLMDSDNTKIIEEGYKVVEKRTLDKVGADLKDAYQHLYAKYHQGN